MKKVFTRLGMPGAANHLTDHIVRKLAHFCEYALEGFLLTLCLRVYTRHFFVHISWPILGGLLTALLGFRLASLDVGCEIAFALRHAITSLCSNGSVLCVSRTMGRLHSQISIFLCL